VIVGKEDPGYFDLLAEEVLGLMCLILNSKDVTMQPVA
jgi:hypothetical protein